MKRKTNCRWCRHPDWTHPAVARCTCLCHGREHRATAIKLKEQAVERETPTSEPSAGHDESHDGAIDETHQRVCV